MSFETKFKSVTFAEDFLDVYIQLITMFPAYACDRYRKNVFI